jgi:hypothetical protein
MILEQTALLRRVWIVTAQTFALLDRLMDHSLVLLFGRIGMARVAQVFHLFLQQAAKTGNMGAVA